MDCPYRSQVTENEKYRFTLRVVVAKPEICYFKLLKWQIVWTMIYVGEKHIFVYLFLLHCRRALFQNETFSNVHHCSTAAQGRQN